MSTIGILTIIFAVLTCAMMVTSLLLKWKIWKIDLYWVIGLLGAIIVVLMNVKSADHVFGALITNSAINPLKILVFFISMTIMSIILDRLNFFNYIATKSVKLAKNSQLKLFFVFYVLVAILTVFTSNDIVILSFVPFICYFCKSSKLNPAPYVFSTFVAANTWSMLFIIGNPTNVYIGTFAGLDFVTYFLKMALPTVVCGVVSLGLLLLLFWKKLKEPIKPVEEEKVEINKPLVIVNACMLLACTILLAVSSYIGLELWYIALGFVGVQLIFNIIYCLVKKESMKYLGSAIKSAPWNFVPFLLSMFLIIMCLDANGVTKILADFFAKGDSVVFYGMFSFLFSNVMNNIPMTTLFASILANGGGMAGVYATIIGSNLGALLSPVGALAGIMFLNILKEKEVDFSIKSFIMYGSIISIVSLAATLAVVAFV